MHDDLARQPFQEAPRIAAAHSAKTKNKVLQKVIIAVTSHSILDHAFFKQFLRLLITLHLERLSRCLLCQLERPLLNQNIAFQNECLFVQCVQINRDLAHLQRVA